MKIKLVLSWCMAAILSIMFVSNSYGQGGVIQASTLSPCPNSTAEYWLGATYNYNHARWSVEGGFIVEQVTGYLTSRIKVLWHDVSVGRVFCQTQSTTHYLDVYPNSVNRVLRNWSQSTTDNYPVGSTGLFIEVHAPGYVGDLKYIWQLPSGWKFHHIMPYEQRFENHIWILTDETSEGVVKVYAENECGSRSAVLTIPVTRKAQ